MREDIVVPTLLTTLIQHVKRSMPNSCKISFFHIVPCFSTAIHLGPGTAAVEADV